jgi:transcriptional regulator with XRE-family HTH domain
MSTDGTPEGATRRGGAEVARLRNHLGWSRATLVDRLRDLLDPSEPNYESISESWLARLENGRMVKVPRPILEALGHALGCTPQERAHLLLLADRNVLAHPDQAPTAVARLLNFVAAQLYNEADEILTTLLEQRQAQTLDEREMLEIVATALEMVIDYRRQS